MMWAIVVSSGVCPQPVVVECGKSEFATQEEQWEVTVAPPPPIHTQRGTSWHTWREPLDDCFKIPMCYSSALKVFDYGRQIDASGRTGICHGVLASAHHTAMPEGSVYLRSSSLVWSLVSCGICLMTRSGIFLELEVRQPDLWVFSSSWAWRFKDLQRPLLLFTFVHTEYSCL